MIIQVKNLRKNIKGKEILKNVNLEVSEGEIYGFLGPNGAGKTTTLRAILGLIGRDHGIIKIFGEDLKKEHYNKMGVVFEYESLNPDWTVWDNLRYTCYMYELPETRIGECLDIVDMKKKEKKFKELSKGMKRKVSIARALLHDPELLILDEPTSGLDPEAQKNIRELLLEFKDQGKTILFSSHNLYEVQKISDRIGIIKDGVTILETRIDEKIYVLQGEYKKLQDYKVLDKDIYVLSENIITEDIKNNARCIDNLEDLYFYIMEEFK